GGRPEADVDRAGGAGGDRRTAGVGLTEVTGDGHTGDRRGRRTGVGDGHRLRRARRVERLRRERQRRRVGAQGRRVGRGTAARVHLELGDLPGRPAGVGGEVQPDVPGGGPGYGDGRDVRRRGEGVVRRTHG